MNFVKRNWEEWFWQKEVFVTAWVGPKLTKSIVFGDRDVRVTQDGGSLDSGVELCPTSPNSNVEALIPM